MYPTECRCVGDALRAVIVIREPLPQFTELQALFLRIRLGDIPNKPQLS